MTIVNQFTGWFFSGAMVFQLAKVYWGTYYCVNRAAFREKEPSERILATNVKRQSQTSKRLDQFFQLGKKRTRLSVINVINHLFPKTKHWYNVCPVFLDEINDQAILEGKRVFQLLTQ